MSARDLPDSFAAGPGCRLGPGAYVAAGTTLGRQVQVGPNVSFVDPEPGQAGAVVEDGVSIGAGAVIFAALTLGRGCLVRPGAVVQRSVPPLAVVEGHPAGIVGYVNMAPPMRLERKRAEDDRTGRVVPTGVRGVTVHNLPLVTDLRGDLTVGEFPRDVPFQPRRYFVVFGVPGREVRGEHAHRRCHQFLVCVKGSMSVVADDGAQRVEVALDAPNRGLYLPPLTWGTQYKHSSDAVLLVFASDPYDAADYIRDYDRFIAAVATVRGGERP
jgi:dTDP-4-dehydrorhamnose 3,5-epimerase-like enzyme